MTKTQKQAGPVEYAIPAAEARRLGLRVDESCVRCHQQPATVERRVCPACTIELRRSPADAPERLRTEREQVTAELRALAQQVTKAAHAGVPPAESIQAMAELRGRLDALDALLAETLDRKPPEPVAPRA